MIDEPGIEIVIDIFGDLLMRTRGNVVDEDIRLSLLNSRERQQPSVVGVRHVKHLLEVDQDLVFE